MSKGLVSVKLDMMPDHGSKNIKGAAMIKGEAQISYRELDYQSTLL